MDIQKKLKEVDFDSIEHFVGYCDEHSKTPRAMFNKKQAALMVRLAGNPKNYPLPQEIENGITKWYSLHEEMGDLVARYHLIRQRIEQSESFEQLLDVAMMIITTTHQPLSMVSGPISTGGKGSPEANIIAMQEYIEELYETGENIFDQTPFEGAMGRIKNKDAAYDYDILNKFYLPIFESGLIKRMFFMIDWQSSTGARWEHEQIHRLGIEYIYQKVVENMSKM